MIKTTIRFRGGPADGSAHELHGPALVGSELRVPAAHEVPEGERLKRAAVYMVTAAEPAPLFDLPVPQELDAHAEFICVD